MGVHLKPEFLQKRLYDRIMKRVEIMPDGCWIFRGLQTKFGYGQTNYWKGSVLAHRGMWIALHGTTNGLDVCHKCDVRNCCNPDHLWLGTHKQNMDDHIAKGRHFERNMTHCKRGHELSGDNVRLYKLGPGRGHSRQCQACMRGRQRVKGGWPEDLAYSAPKIPPTVMTDRRRSIYPIRKKKAA